MTNGSSDRLTQVESLLQQLAESLKQQKDASDERMRRIEQERDADRQESNKRLTRIEQAVESNNRFLEAFGRDVKRFTETASNLTNRIDGVIFTANQDRQETNIRLSRIENKVDQLLSRDSDD